MNAFNGVSAIAMLAASGLAMADTAGSVDVYYAPDAKLKVNLPGVPNKLESNGGNAYGVRGQVSATPQIFVAGEYQKSSYDGLDGDNDAFDVEWLRVGVGHSTPMNLYVIGQFVRLEGEADSQNGWGAQVGYHTDLGNPWELRGQVGYLDVGDAGDGFELLVGCAFEVTKPVRFFADYRVTTLEDDEDVKVQRFDVIAGLRIRF